MKSNFLKTKSAQFFLQLYNRSSIQEAAEYAAEKERENLLPGYETQCKIPVDIEVIAKRKGIILNKEFLNKIEGEAALIPSPLSGYTVKLAQDGTIARYRYSLAHEIGHTFFRSGMKHRIGMLSKMEQEAEEFICHRFAASLLMPKAHVFNFLTDIPIIEPWDIFSHFERAARWFGVSIPFLVSRVGQVRYSEGKSLIFLCLRYFPNISTILDPCLRVDICSPLGSLSNIRTWRNRSAVKLHLFSAEKLFKKWVIGLTGEKESTGGKYVFVDSGQVIRATQQTTKWSHESIFLSIITDGKWRNETIDMLSSNVLYAKKEWDKKQVYILSVLKKS